MNSTIIYHACLTILLDLSSGESRIRWGLTSSQDRIRRQLKVHGLQVCLHVLSYCATKSPDAQTLVENVRTFQQLLDGQRPSTLKSTEEDFPPQPGPPPPSSDSSSSSWFGSLSTTPFTIQSPPGWSSNLASDRMTGTEFGEPGAFSSQTSASSGISSGSFLPTPYFPEKPWGSTNRLLHGTNFDTLMAKESGQPCPAPPYVQSSFHEFPNHQSSQLGDQYGDSPFSAG